MNLYSPSAHAICRDGSSFIMMPAAEMLKAPLAKKREGGGRRD